MFQPSMKLPFKWRVFDSLFLFFWIEHKSDGVLLPKTISTSLQQDWRTASRGKFLPVWRHKYNCLLGRTGSWYFIWVHPSLPDSNRWWIPFTTNLPRRSRIDHEVLYTNHRDPWKISEWEHISASQKNAPIWKKSLYGIKV